MKKIFLILASALTLINCSCTRNKLETDASGVFESDEVIVSAEQTGKILSFSIKEGNSLSKGQVVGQIDMSTTELQKQQIQATITSLREKTTNPTPAIDLIKQQQKVLESQLEHQIREQNRVQNLIKAGAGTQKQLDDINAVIDELQKQINVTKQQLVVSKTTIATQNRAILSEQSPLEKSAEQVQSQINKGQIINPIAGVVLSKYALEGEMATVGKALYKIANVDTLILRAYITESQLTEIKLGQQVRVFTDDSANNYKEYLGQISWISEKSEFTPKTIQTKDERANLVYAIKIRVKNNGYIKLGMYGEVIFKYDRTK